MPTPFVILTGASGVGKTSIAQAIEDRTTEIRVFQGDRIGLPPAHILADYGPTNEPGGPSQRGFALYWIGIIADELERGRPVLLETQCRIAFLHEALAMHGITNTQIILVECADAMRKIRLEGRGHPELANEQMSNWSRFLHREAEEFGHTILDTTATPLEQSTLLVLSLFTQKNAVQKHAASVE